MVENGHLSALSIGTDVPGRAHQCRREAVMHDAAFTLSKHPRAALAQQTLSPTTNTTHNNNMDYIFTAIAPLFHEPTPADSREVKKRVVSTAH